MNLEGSGYELQWHGVGDGDGGNEGWWLVEQPRNRRWEVAAVKMAAEWKAASGDTTGSHGKRGLSILKRVNITDMRIGTAASDVARYQNSS